MWPGTSPYFIDLFRPVLNTLHSFVRRGKEVHFFEGNHDFNLGTYFTDNLGIHIYKNGHSFEWNGIRVYITHGDLGNRKEWAYHIFRSIVRTKAVRLSARIIPQRWLHKLGSKASKLSHDYQAQGQSIEDEVRLIYRRSATEILLQGYDVVLMGHTHIPDDYTININGKICRYLNTGDWVKNFSYLEFDGTQFYTKRHCISDD